MNNNLEPDNKSLSENDANSPKNAPAELVSDQIDGAAGQVLDFYNE